MPEYNRPSSIQLTSVRQIEEQNLKKTRKNCEELKQNIKHKMEFVRMINGTHMDTRSKIVFKSLQIPTLCKWCERNTYALFHKP
uniref:Uncharacterized protein n=1 Tax=Romanomermis culicivorax TaxID=13658 RepID=A0A915J743_ROMCU